MILRSLAVVVFAVSVSAAEPSLESLSASSNLSMPAIGHFAASPAPAKAAAGRPPHHRSNGTVTGAIGGVAVDLRFNRRGGHVTGALEQQAVSLDLQGDGNAATGSAFGQGVDYTVKTNDDGSFTFDGHVRGQGFNYTLSDAEHTVKGAIGGRGVDITFDLQSGAAKGSAGGMGFDLSVDNVSGKMTGAIGGQTVALTLVNEDLGGFLQNLFLFVK